MKQVYLILFAVILMSSCKSAKETMRSSTSLFDTKWSLKKIYTGDAIQSVETKAFIRFNKEKGSAGGNGSCNSFGINATVNGNEVSFKNIFSTKMYCEQVQQIENNYFGKLGQTNRFEIKDQTLLLYHDKEKLLEFSADEQTKSTK